jgi:hypothetical protein
MFPVLRFIDRPSGNYACFAQGSASLDERTVSGNPGRSPRDTDRALVVISRRGTRATLCVPLFTK